MNHLKYLILFFYCVNVAASQSDTTYKLPRQMIGKKVPNFQKTTIDGKVIDSNYFKNKVTSMCFFSFGCAPCYKELRILDEMSKKLDKEKHQILLVGNASEKDLRDLRATKSKYKKMKRKMGIDSLAFDIVSDCPDVALRIIHRGCKGSTEMFMVNGSPTTFFINKEGVIKEVCTGFTLRPDPEFDQYFYSLLREAEK